MTTSLLRSLAGGLFLTGMFTSAVPAPAQTLQYPAARKSDVVDDYHGTRVPDPYRWLEDPDSPESRAWIEAENRLTVAYLDRKSTRLNSSHLVISYAVFCLKKKNNYASTCAQTRSTLS